MTATTRSTVAGLVWAAITAVALVAALSAVREPAPAPTPTTTTTATTTVTTPVAPCDHPGCPPWPSLDY
ncbi:hypothetical protein [Corynebacterium freneyi]|uniref:Uncharacterized protein n=1 Tax=Corynebacterium freneyi TaxID=134034 RepID=A0ABS4U968_9CORY|nr:hypothetical protein [Corynebacterium freneyi]MBP2333068.1 hypothetical protein [Corynebacterium freneyi]QXA52837.1 hypothetical protein I6L56_12655 [Corynebacterium freneyi]WJZ04830.1 hypothetical protein CFREN_04260 [Corynebacterium freneyi]